MSNYRAPAIHPGNRQIEQADYLDNHFGHRVYGVRFDDGSVYRLDQLTKMPEAPANPDSALRQALEKARDALAPFAASASDWDGFPDDTSMLGAMDTLITVGDLRRAREAHALITEALQGGEK